jgi:uncharacterized protein (TIGR04255 family)
MSAVQTLPDIIFKSPPAKEVQLWVQFNYSLAVSDFRSKFADKVKADFPTVYIPEQSQMKYDFGDYALYSANSAEHLEVGVGYFRLVTSSYPGFGPFSDKFLQNLRKFSESYGIQSFVHFTLRYSNQLPMPEGKAFQDCFEIELKLPENLSYLSFAAKGLMLLQQQEGFVAAEFDPQVEGNRIVSYGLNLSFAAQKDFPLEEVQKLARQGHEHLHRFFFSILKEQYLAFLQGPTP